MIEKFRMFDNAVTSCGYLVVEFINKNKNEVIQKFKEFKNKDNLMNYLNELVSEVIFNEDRTLEIRFNFKLN